MPTKHELLVEYEIDRHEKAARQEGETPRTDAAEYYVSKFKDGDIQEFMATDSDFARTLERELSAKQAEVEQEQSNVRVLLFDQETLKTQLHNAKSELESLKATQGWREIETAPKDGTKFLGYGVLNIVRDGARNSSDPVAHVLMWSEASQDWWSPSLPTTETFYPLAHRPTHWMPLPTPPVERSVDGE